MIRSFRTLAMPHRTALAIAVLLPVAMMALSIGSVTRGLEQASALRRIERADVEGAPSRLNAAKQVWLHATARGLAEAELEGYAGDIFAANRLVQGSMEVVSSYGGDGSIMLDVTASGNLASLRRALFALETGRPVVFVRRLAIHGADQSPSAGAPAPLEIRMRLEAFARTEAGR